MKPKLLHCPFCGKKANYEETELLGDVRKSAGCVTDGCQGYQSQVTFATYKEAAKAWNTRADEAGTPANRRAARLRFDMDNDQ